MKKNLRKITYTTLALVLVAGAALAAAGPDKAAAKWLGLRQHNEKQAAPVAGEQVAVAEQAAVTEQAAVGASAIEVEENSEAEVSVDGGKVARVVISETASATKVVPVDREEAAKLQAAVASGHQPWLLNPVQVVKNNAAAYGFSAEHDTFTLISQIYKGQQSQTGEALVLVGHGDHYYLVKLIQPAGSGQQNIWQVTAVREVRAEVRDKKPDVGPGVEGLDYDKVIKWQQAVDEGRDQWRLDPLQVAKSEGRAYGFGDGDSFTVVRTLSASAIARHGQVDVEVKHDGKVYTMIIVRPFGGGGAIWTTYKVTETGSQPAPQPPNNRVVFQTDKYAGWNWYKGAYPPGMAMAVVVDYASQLRDDRIPEFVLARAKDVDYSQKAVLFAYLGAGGGADAIGIEKVTVAGNNMTVVIRARSVKPGEMETKNLTNPSDFVAIDRNLVDIWGGVNVTFVDQHGKVLSRNKVTIRHN